MSIAFSELNHRYLYGFLSKKATHTNYVRIHSQFFADWTDHPTRPQIKQWHDQHAEHPTHANKALGYLRAMYNWAMNEGLWELANPAVGIKRHQTFSRERVMDLREVKLILGTLDFLNEKYHAWFKCRLLVPCRVTELCAMRRDAVDPYGKWTKTKTKKGRPHVIHIPTQALSLLQALPVEGDYFFMGHYGQPLSPCAVRKIWNRYRTDLKLNDLWLLDFRRTIATYLYRVLKVDDLTAKAVLNHYDSRPVAVYTRLDYDYLATIIQGYADWIMAHKQGGQYETIKTLAHAAVDPLSLRPAELPRIGMG